MLISIVAGPSLKKVRLLIMGFWVAIANVVGMLPTDITDCVVPRGTKISEPREDGVINRFKPLQSLAVKTIRGNLLWVACNT